MAVKLKAVLMDIAAVDSLSLRKPTGMVHVLGGDFNEVEHKVLNSAIAYIQRYARDAHGMVTSEMVSVPVEQFLESIGRVHSPANVDDLKQTFQKLVKLQLNWNSLGVDKRRGKWGIYNVFQGFDIKDGLVKYAFTSMVVSEVIAPQLYARLRLRVANNISGLYAKRLYELVVDESCRSGSANDFDEYVTRVYEIDTLRRLLGLEKEYEDFRDFNKRVIRDSLVEINSKSDCEITVESWEKGAASGRGRPKVSGVSFRLKRKQAFDELPLFAVPQEPDPLVMKLKGMGLDVPSEYLTKYPREVVESAVRYTEGEIAAGKVKNVGAYVAKAIKSDFGKKFREQATLEVLMSRKACLRERLLRRETEAEGKLVSEVREFLERQSDDAKHDLCRSFLASEKGRRFVGVNRLYAEYRGAPSFFPVFLTSVGDRTQDIAGSLAFAAFCRENQSTGCISPDTEMASLTRELAEVSSQLDALEKANKQVRMN